MRRGGGGGVRDTFDADADAEEFGDGDDERGAEARRREMRALKNRGAGVIHELEAALGALDGVESLDAAIVEKRKALVERCNGALEVLDGLQKQVGTHL